MKSSTRLRAVALCFAALLATARGGSSAVDYAVQVSARIVADAAAVEISWEPAPRADEARHTVARKEAGGAVWGEPVALAGDATRFRDEAVVAGKAYEYQVVRTTAPGDRAYGYVQAGFDLPLVEHRGRLVLIVDRTHAAELSEPLRRLEEDLAGDGWTVMRHDVAPSDSPAAVKRLVVSEYRLAPSEVKAVFLFGRVPVPYSGALNPDGHLDHIGAWPADAYYGDMDGDWSDVAVDFVQLDNTDPRDAARLTNLPGDGKFDPSALPSAVELQVGRVDLSNLPGRAGRGDAGSFASEPELLRQYLEKDHAYRHGRTEVARRAVIGDYFGVRGGEAYAAGGYRNFAPLVGRDGITDLNREYANEPGVWVPTLSARSYLFAYGCGPGSYRTCAGLGDVGRYNDTDTVEVVNAGASAVFNLLFGSWYGDWDHEDGFLRSVLATRTNGLVAVWSGRPNWFLHGMGLGETIGAAAQRTQNNDGIYRTQVMNAVRGVHVALLGDPTLRLYPVPPPVSLRGQATPQGVRLAWEPSAAAVRGYHVYRAPAPGGRFTRLNSELLGGTNFTDSAPVAGSLYQVRAVTKETSPSGSYFNASQGVFWRSRGDSDEVIARATTAVDSAGALGTLPPAVPPADLVAAVAGHAPRRATDVPPSP